MKLRKCHQKFIFIFIILISLEYSKCQSVCSSSSCTSSENGLSCGSSCDSNCKPKYGSDKCYDCTGITNGDYYTINQNGDCLINVCRGDKIIENKANTNECTFQIFNPSGSLYKVGESGEYYYYLPSTINTNIYTCTGNICSCTKYYYIETIFGKNKYTCIGDLSTIPSTNYKYYNYNTGQLFQTGCPSGYEMKKTNNPSGFTRCSNACIGSEKIKQVQNSANNLIEYYCVDDCSNESPYIYEYTDNNGKNYCLENCPEGYYKYTDANDNNNKKCVTREECDYYISGTNCEVQCPDGTPYHNKATKQCISSCTGEYKYIKTADKSCNRREDCNFYKVDSNSNYLCYDNCPNYYSEYGTNKCLDNCDSNQYRANEGPYEKICFSSCKEIPGGEYIYEGTNKICYYSDPNCEAYYKKADGILKCSSISDCVTNNKKYILNKECRDNCDGYYQLEIIEATHSYIKCYETLNTILSDESANVKFCDTKLRRCWVSFPENEQYYINSEITLSPGSSYELLKECNNYYYSDADPTDSTKTRLWCVSNCKSKGKYFYKGSKECKSSCNDFGKYYFNENNYECVDSCESVQDKPFSYPMSENKKECQESCDTGKFYDYDSHTCISTCGLGNSLYLYYKYDGKICYPSCLIIPQRGTYKYILDNNGCVGEAERTARVCVYYFKLNNLGLYKCATEDDCINSGNKYLTGSECSNKCDEDKYQLNSGSSSFTYCLNTPNDCQDKLAPNSELYYHNRLKMCWNSYQSTYFQKSETNSNNLIELVDECDNFYFVENSKKICINSCSAKSLYYIAGNKECIQGSVCVNNKKYYYDNNNECLDTCKGRNGLEYQKEIFV